MKSLQLSGRVPSGSLLRGIGTYFVRVRALDPTRDGTTSDSQRTMGRRTLEKETWCPRPSNSWAVEYHVAYWYFNVKFLGISLLKFGYREAWCSDNALELYSGCVWFEPLSVHQLSYIGVFVVFFSPSGKMPDYYFSYATVAFCHILSSLLLTRDSTIRSYVLQNLRVS
jgi:hypothetical protein